MKSGRVPVFQTVGPATEKARRPTFIVSSYTVSTSCWDGSEVLQVVELTVGQHWRPGRSIVRQIRWWWCRNTETEYIEDAVDRRWLITHLTLPY